jgi:probable selenium-dependent hydroxylase accessory protein YqeC
MLLVDALGARREKVIVLVGGGGKTTTMYRLGRELSDLGDKVVVTTTTRINMPGSDEVHCTIIADDRAKLLSSIRDNAPSCRIAGVGFDVFEDGKLKGIPPEWVAEVAGLVDHVVVEADGAAEKPFKAPADYEPVIPDCADLVVAVVGVEVVGLTLARENVHRPERIQAITGLAIGEVVTPAVVAEVLLHPRGITKGAPDGSRVVVLINKVEDDVRLDAAREIGRLLLQGGIERVVIARVRDDPPVIEAMEK